MMEIAANTLKCGVERGPSSIKVLSEGIKEAEAKSGGDDRLRASLGEVPREQRMLKGHLPRVMYNQAY